MPTVYRIIGFRVARDVEILIRAILDRQRMTLIHLWSRTGAIVVGEARSHDCFFV